MINLQLTKKISKYESKRVNTDRLIPAENINVIYNQPST